MKKYYLFLLAVLMFGLLELAQVNAQSAKLGFSALQSYQVTNKSSELEIQVFVDNPGLSFTSLTFSVTNPVGVYFYGASTFDDAYHWTYILHDDSVRYRNSVTDFYKVRKPFIFTTDGRVVGPDSGFVLKLHFKIDQPSVYPAGDTLVIWLSAAAAFNGNVNVPVQPTVIDVRVPFGEKIEDPDPEVKDSVSFNITQVAPVTPASSEVVMRFQVLNQKATVNKMEYSVQIPPGVSYGSVSFATETDGLTYTGEAILIDAQRNSYQVFINTSDGSYFRANGNSYVDLHCVINQPTSYQTGDTASFMFFAVKAWKMIQDTMELQPVKYPAGSLWSMFVKKTVVFGGTIPEITDSVAFTIEQLAPINVDSDQLNLRVSLDNPGYDINKYEFMLRMPTEFHPVDIATVPDTVGSEYIFSNSTPRGLEYYFTMYQRQEENSFGDKTHMNISLQIEKPHDYQVGDTAKITIFIVHVYKITADTLIDYPVKGYQEEFYNLAYQLPIIFTEGSAAPDTTDLFFETWVDDANHFWPENKEVTVFLKRSDLTNVWTQMDFNLNIQSKYANIDEFHIDGLAVADNVELQTADQGSWFEANTNWDYDQAGNYVGTVAITALGILPNPADNNPADFLKFTVRYRDVYSEELTMTLGNISAQTATSGIIAKTDRIASLLNLDSEETITVNLVEPFRKLLADPNDVNDDGVFDIHDVALAFDFADWEVFGNLKARIAADAAEPFNREIDYNDCLELMKRLNMTDVNNDSYYDPINLRNYPNPVEQTTMIYFSLPFSGEINLSLYDILGQKVKTLASGYYQAGNQSLQVDCSELPTGTYTYLLQVGSVQKTQRLLVK